MMPKFVKYTILLIIVCATIFQCTDNSPVGGQDVQNNGYSWCLQNPLPTSNSLLDVEYIDDQAVMAISDAGTILYSNNGGYRWHEKWKLPYVANSIYFINKKEGWVAGENGMIMHYCNREHTWYEHNSGIKSNISAITFVNDLCGWAVSTSGDIIKTINRGKTWHLQKESSSSYFRDVLFVNERIGWAIGLSSTSSYIPELIYTNNGGSDWIRVDLDIQNSHKIPDDYILYDLYSISASSMDTITIVGKSIQSDNIGGIRIHSIDGGESWDVFITDFPHYDVKYVSKDSGFIVGYGGTIYSTVNGGRSWEIIESSAHSLNSISFSSGQSGCAIGSNGTIMLSSDSKDNWEKITRGSQNTFWDIQFIDKDYGWVAGFDGVFLTIDGGRIWEQTNGTANQALCFLDRQIGYAIDYLGNLDKTTDGGIFWTRVNDAIESRVYDMIFTDNLIGWVVGMPGILKTTDGGQTWVEQWLGSGIHLNGIKCVDSLLGWTVGDDGLILHTKNGGDLWQTQETPTTSRLESVFFIDSLQGWAVGESSILTTSNGGLDWEFQAILDTLGNLGLRSVTFIDSDTGWVVGNHGLILGTKDGGNSWQRQSTSISAHLSCISALDSKTAWVAGWAGSILHTKR